MMSSQWYYRKGSEQFGPVSGLKIKELAASGQLLPTDMLRGEGIEEWFPASKFSWLFASVRPISSPSRQEPVAPPEGPVPPPILPKTDAAPDGATEQNPAGSTLFGYELPDFSSLGNFSYTPSAPVETARPSTPTPAPAVKRPKPVFGPRSNLYVIAWRLRALVYLLFIFILANVLLMPIIYLSNVAGDTMSNSSAAFFGLTAFLLLAIAGLSFFFFWVFTLLLGNSTGFVGENARWIWSYPFIAPVILLFAAWREALRQLRAAGYKVGPWGINANEVR